MTAPSGDRRPSAHLRVRTSFHTTFGRAPEVVWSAPGRVNLIGEHTDYNDGFVLPFALGQRTAVAVSRDTEPRRGTEPCRGTEPSRDTEPRRYPEPHRDTEPRRDPEPSRDTEPDGLQWTVYSEAVGETVTFGEADLRPGADGTAHAPGDTGPGTVDGWAGYVASIVWVLRDAGVAVPSARIALCSDVPVGAGLSSSAALECAVLAALVDLAGADLPVARWPALAQRAENAYVGVPCGILDQSAATLCRDGHALFLDCRDTSTEHVPFALTDAGLCVLVIDTRAPHRHSEGEYAARRASCEAAAAALGVPALRDVTDLGAALARLDDDVMRRRTRHIVTENDRVLATVALLREHRYAEIGPLLTASHASMRDDFEITVPEVDLAAETAVAAGALGARMTGGGFGGCVIALVATERAATVADAVAKAFAGSGFTQPVAFVATPSAGVHRD